MYSVQLPHTPNPESEAAGWGQQVGRLRHPQTHQGRHEQIRGRNNVVFLLPFLLPHLEAVPVIGSRSPSCVDFLYLLGRKVLPRLAWEPDELGHP